MSDDRTYMQLEQAGEWPDAGGADRLLAYVEWFGDGIIKITEDDRGVEYVIHSRDLESITTENAALRTELASRDADIIGQQTIIAILQKKLREAEDEASTKRAAARQAEDIQIANGLMTTVIPTAVVVDETSPQ